MIFIFNVFYFFFYDIKSSVLYIFKILLI